MCDLDRYYYLPPPKEATLWGYNWQADNNNKQNRTLDHIINCCEASSVSNFTDTKLIDSNLLCAFLDAQNEHRSVNIFTAGHHMPLTSTVLGFNYYENTLLIDAIQPPTSQSTLQANPFWLQLQHGEQWLNVQCSLLESHYDLYTLGILKCELSDNQRWFSRIYFDRHRGPQIRINIDDQLPIQGHIRNLSVHGALAEFYGMDIRNSLSKLKHCDCNIRFNDMFSIDLRGEVRKLSFERNPSCHSLLRFTVSSHNALTYSQLDNFIEALSSVDSVLSHSAWQKSTGAFTSLAIPA